MKNSLDVYIEGRLVGTLQNEGPHHFFRYQKNTPTDDFVSLTMPVRFEDYKSKSLHPIFEMHLPEGYLFAVIEKHFAKLVGAGQFNLLGLMAPYIKGRLNYNREETVDFSLSLDELRDPKQNLFEELVERFAFRSAISGVQPKVIARVKDKAALVVEDFIVKAWGSDYPELSLNEFWCMQLFREAQIAVPEFYLSKDAQLFIMRRFDVAAQGVYLGFEDVCTLQAKNSKQKYEGSYEQIAKTVQTFASAKNKTSSLRQLFKMIVLNNFLQNGDAHLKNFGMLYKDAEHIWIAPAYDIVSTTAYIQKDLPALTLFGARKWVSKNELLQFGIERCMLTRRQADLLYKVCIEATKRIKGKIKKELEKTRDEAQSKILTHLYTLMANATSTR